jgi:hypothetical protein
MKKPWPKYCGANASDGESPKRMESCVQRV